MITNSSEKELFSKQEAEQHKDNKAAITSSRSWSGLKDPRIVRVSRLFGGKDRHSKVSTVRGLRDRRVRLSVPTAIQLYDLQDRLGLNQPSKVVDWLLKAAEHDIDKLPPLQIPPGINFLHFPRSSLSSSIPPPPPPDASDQPQPQTQPQSQALLSPSKPRDEFQDLALLQRPTTLWKTGTKEADKSSINEGSDVVEVHHGRVFRPIHPSFSSLLHNQLPYNTSYYHYDPSVSLASHSSSNHDEVSHGHLHPPSIISSPNYMMPSLLTSYAISQNEFCNKDSSHFQMPSSTTTTSTTTTTTTTSSSEGGLPLNHLIRTSPHSASYPMTYFHSNLAPKH